MANIIVNYRPFTLAQEIFVYDGKVENCCKLEFKLGSLRVNGLIILQEIIRELRPRFHPQLRWQVTFEVR